MGKLPTANLIYLTRKLSQPIAPRFLMEKCIMKILRILDRHQVTNKSQETLPSSSKWEHYPL